MAIGAAKAGIKAKVTSVSSPPSSPQQSHSFRAAAANAATSHATSLGKTAGKKYIDAYLAIPRLMVRGLQLILALVAAGIYGARLNAEREPSSSDSTSDSSVSPEWIFAVCVASLSAVTAALFALSTPLSFLFSRLETYKAFAWDLFMAVMWIIIFAVFATIFVRRSDEDGEYKGANTAVMKGALWLDLSSALLWIGTGAFGATRRFASDKIGAAGEKVSQKVVGKMFTKTETSQV